LLCPHPPAEIDRHQHHAHAKKVDPDGQKGSQEIGICCFVEIDLDAEGDDNPQDGVEENIGARGAGESASDVKGCGGNENISKTSEGEEGVGPLDLLDDAKQERKEEDRHKRNAFGKWETHSFSFSTRNRFYFRRPLDGEFRLAVEMLKV
jgi:hypothetical protein